MSSGVRPDPVSVSAAWRTVRAVASVRPGLEEVRLEDGSLAFGYPPLVGRLAPGRRVLVNTTAVELGLGTGGFHVVVAQEGASLTQGPAGHLLKLRYLPHQAKVVSPEEPGTETHAVLAEAEDVAGLPVVCLGLHSQLAPAVAAFKARAPERRAVYVMTDEAALYAPLSHAAAGLRAAGLLEAVLTAGQALGGDVECVNLFSALLTARHVLRADAAFVGIGPGNIGTGTPFGHGGVAQGVAVNAAAALGGRPVAVLRLSAVDPRARHRGVSHHTRVALTRVALAPSAVAVPDRLTPPMRALVAAELAGEAWRRHRAVEVAVGDWTALLAEAGVAATSMGRTPADDPDFFEAAAAGGALAAQLAREAGGEGDRRGGR